MLFNSYEFIFGFLPLTVIIFFGLVRFRLLKLATYWLTISSLIFYGYWNPAYVPLLIISIIGNFFFGSYLSTAKPGTRSSQVMLWLGIGFNLAILGYYKYAGFLIDSFNHVLQTTFPIPEIILPLGISFYSFTQIAYLVDAYHSSSRNNYDLLTYTLFVVFFPQLIAGPILRHDELIPEFRKLKNFVFSNRNIAYGLTLFILGLAKKVLLADPLSPWVAEVFTHANEVTLVEAWFGAIAYTLQLYFDFSGYSDMAIGLGLIFNIHLPINFNSPYKATSIIDFWRRWHITLSNFLRDYLYIPLGGNRKGSLRRYVNLIITMLLGGLWHGAGWTYILWGGLHGCFLAINHGWRKLGCQMPNAIAWLMTFMAVVFSWVFFRSSNWVDAVAISKAMLGLSSITLPADMKAIVPWLSQWRVEFAELPHLPSNHQQALAQLAVLLGGVMVLPNTQQIMQRFQPSWQWAIALSSVTVLCLISLNRVSEFLYFQF